MLVARYLSKAVTLTNFRKMCDKCGANPMGIKANVYDKVTGAFQHKDGSELINKIANENKQRKFDTAINIGCGTGNTTLLLQQKLNVNRVYAIDIDNDMISFAKQNNANHAIKYSVQDISSEWSELNEELKHLENHVSLIFTNHVLHWTERKENVAKNLFRLLTPNGSVYANIYVIVNPFKDMDAEERAINERQYMCVPSPEQQMQIWSNLFTSNQLEVNQCDQIFHKNFIEFEKFKSILIPMSVNQRRQYIVSKDESKRDEISKHLSPLIWDRDYNKYPQLIDEESGEKIIEFSYSYYRFVLTKKQV